MSYLLGKEKNNKKGKKRYYKALNLLFKLEARSVISLGVNTEDFKLLTKTIRKFKKNCKKKDIDNYCKEESCKYFKDLTIYKIFRQFLSNDIKRLENNKLDILNNFKEQIFPLIYKSSEKDYLNKVFDIFANLLSFNTDTELREFIDDQQNYYNLIYNYPKFKKFPKDNYYSLIPIIFLEFIRIKARETDVLNTVRRLLEIN